MAGGAAGEGGSAALHFPYSAGGVATYQSGILCDCDAEYTCNRCMFFLQFPYWTDPSNLQITNLSRIEYIVSDTDFTIVLRQLPAKLREVEPRVPCAGKELEFFTSALTAADTAASPTNYKTKYHVDIRLYMEASLIANRKQQREKRPRLLVMKDFKFFKGFVRSAYAHDILRNMVLSVLKLTEGITVLLAGEVIEVV